MEPIEEKIFVQHGVDVTFVTFNDEEILAEQHVKELEEEIMTVVEQAKRQNMMMDFCNIKFMTSAFLGLLIKVHKRLREREGHLKLRHIDPKIYKVFEITQLTRVFDIS
ncbi:MAG: STAS domain-containing protein [Planctomycetota bacterium]|jgi:anti-sigma B factor antagonist